MVHFILPGMAISDNGDTKTYHNELGQPREAMGVAIVSGDTMTYANSRGDVREALGVVVLGGSGGGEGGPVAWDDVTGKPATFPPIIGTTADTAKAGDYAPTWGQVTGKPAVIGAGATQQEARTAIGALNAALVGVANGVAPLDASGLVPLQHLNVSGLSFRGAWNASTNTPPLLDGEGSVGDFYKVSVPGTYNFGNGSYTFAMGDWVMFAAGVWQRLGVHETVAAVNGQTGMVQLTAADVGARPITYVPSWAEVTGKPDFPNLYAPRRRGSISHPIPALRRTLEATLEVPASTVTVIRNLTGPGYDEFGMLNVNGDITIPSWATHARVTVAGRLQALTETERSNLSIYLGGALLVEASMHGIAGSILGSGALDTGIISTPPGSVFQCRIWHNHTASRGVVVSGTFVNVELFES